VVVVWFLQNNQNLVILRCCFFAELYKEMHKDFFAHVHNHSLCIESFVCWRSRFRCCCGLFPNWNSKILSRTAWYLIIAKNEFEIGMINYKRRKHQSEKRTFCVFGKKRASLLFTYCRHCNSLFLFLNSHNPFTWHVNRYLVMALIIRAQSVNTCFASITILLFFGRVALFLERSSKTRHRIFNEEFKNKM